MQKLIGKLSVAPPPNMQLEWFLSGLPELLDFEVRKADPQTLPAAIAIAKKYEKSAVLSGRWAEKQMKKKVTFALCEESSDDSSDRKVRPVALKTSNNRRQEAMLAKIVKDELKSELQPLTKQLEDVKVQLADVKKGRKPVPQSRTNVWCTRWKKEGHFSNDCQADWRLIQEEELSPQEVELFEMETMYAI